MKLLKTVISLGVLGLTAARLTIFYRKNLMSIVNSLRPREPFERQFESEVDIKND